MLHGGRRIWYAVNMNHRKAVLSILLSFALFFSMLAGFCLQVAAEEEAAPVNLVILHTNDVHGRAIGDYHALPPGR